MDAGRAGQRRGTEGNTHLGLAQDWEDARGGTAREAVGETEVDLQVEEVGCWGRAAS